LPYCLGRDIGNRGPSERNAPAPLWPRGRLLQIHETKEEKRVVTQKSPETRSPRKPPKGKASGQGGCSANSGESAGIKARSVACPKTGKKGGKVASAYRRHRNGGPQGTKHRTIAEFKTKPRASARSATKKETRSRRAFWRRSKIQGVKTKTCSKTRGVTPGRPFHIIGKTGKQIGPPPRECRDEKGKKTSGAQT